MRAHCLRGDRVTDDQDDTGDREGPITLFSPKKPNPIDIHVGSRVRLRRMLVGMSQEKLGERMGLTFQQIQKYEKGVNRIGASRLYQLAYILKVPVGFFYDELEFAENEETGRVGFGEPQGESFILDFLNSREGLELNRAFVRIRSPRVRRSLVDLARNLARADSETEAAGEAGKGDEPTDD